MMALEALRGEIDRIDDEITALLAQRMALAVQVAGEKRRSGAPVLHQDREQAIIARLCARLDAQWHTSLKLVYQAMFQASRACQQQLLAIDGDSALQREIAQAAERGKEGFPAAATVACQGIAGAYSHLAAQQMFAGPNIVFVRTFDAVFRAVEQGLCRYGVLPIENSSFGSVTPVYDLLKRHNCRIVRAARLPIEHCLLSRARFLKDVREIFSHEQAIGQCGEFLEKLPKGVSVTVCENTAVAARMAAEREEAAAISSEECAEIYKLEVLKRNIQNEPRNETRFICIARQAEIYPAPAANKTSVLLNLKHRPGSLAALLQLLSALGINLTKLENRPAPGKEFEFLFYLDMECDAAQPGVICFLEEMARQSEDFLLLGSYWEG